PWWLGLGRAGRGLPRHQLRCSPLRRPRASRPDPAGERLMTGSQPVLLLLSARRRVIDKARGLGLEVVHIEAPTMSEPELRDLCRYSTLADLLDIAGVVRLARPLHQRFGFAGVTSNHEPACVAAEAVALDLGLRAPG